MTEPSIADVTKELHSDLKRKYYTHAATIQQYWRAFDRKQRTQCIRAGAADGAVLEHSLDVSLGNVYKFIPEINLRDITNPGSDFLLDVLKHRATNSLLDQYVGGLDGGLGDHAFITQMMDVRNLRLADPMKDTFTLFLDEEKYGQSVTVLRDASNVWAALAPAVRAGRCVPHELGQLILLRQQYTLQILNIVVEDILDTGATTRLKGGPPSKKSDAVALATFSKLSVEEPAKNLSLREVTDSAADWQQSLQDHLALLLSEPILLTHAVNIWFFTRPELVPDEKGRVLPVHTDKYISAAVLDAVYNPVKALAVWSYIGRLLSLVNSPSACDKTYRAIVIQELSNVCHLEFTRAQSLLRRSVQSGTGAKWFKRLSNAYDKAGNARVVMKGDPDVLTRTDPHLRYTLRLCQPETDAAKATNWLKKLSDLYMAHPSEREKLGEREAGPLGDLAMITSLIRDLSSVMSMPSLSRKKNQTFVGWSHQLDTDMNILKSKIDLRNFVVPIDNLLEPGVAAETLVVLDQYIADDLGTTMGSLHQDLVEECLAEVERQHESLKALKEQKTPAEGSQTTTLTSEPRERRVQQRRQKEKTRPPHSSVFDIVTTAAQEELPEEERSPVFKVRASTAEVFSRLFARVEARGSISWAAFVSAMTDLGFSVQPKTGSLYTFSPPESMHVRKSLTLHRPHKSEIERHLALVYAKRLRTAYGWSGKAFELDD